MCFKQGEVILRRLLERPALPEQRTDVGFGAGQFTGGNTQLDARQDHAALVKAHVSIIDGGNVFARQLRGIELFVQYVIDRREY